ncbi:MULTISPECIES: DUF4177 domain-containing protein [unclassified Pseudoxanthomonas]|jgi:hypothetical protein|uniref:DUF4177 domain-containing protein n=1 Tax=unclassified Pseudoxanthomonas TaxID=2645906 RepID=UPI003076B386
MSKRWSHKVIEVSYKLFGGKLNDRVQEELDKMGSQGWELVSATSGHDYSVRLFFKREG